MRNKSQLQWEIEQERNKSVINSVVAITLFFLNFGAIALNSAHPQLTLITTITAATLSGIILAMFTEQNVLLIFCTFFLAIISTHFAYSLLMAAHAGIEISQANKMFIPEDFATSIATILGTTFMWVSIFTSVYSTLGALALRKSKRGNKKR